MRQVMNYFCWLIRSWLDWWEHKPTFDHSGKGRSLGWYEARQKHLNKEPRCQWCGGKICLEVHTILPWHIFPEKQLDEDNLITLCEAPDKNCHFNHGHGRRWIGYTGNVRALCEERQNFLKNQTSELYNLSGIEAQ